MTRWPLAFVPLGRMTVCLVIALAVWSAHAATLWVAPTGADTGPATEAQPVASIAAAMKLAKPGDTVLLKPGVYPAGQSCNGRGTAQAPIIVKAAGAGVVIEGRSEAKIELQPVPGSAGVYVARDPGPLAGVAVDLADSPLAVDPLASTKDLAALRQSYLGYWHDAAAGLLYLRYRGGEPLTGHSVHVLRDGGGLSVSGEYLRVEGLTLRHLAGSGLGVGQARQVTLSRCRVSHCGYQWAAAIGLWQTRDVTLEDCVLYRVRNGLLAQSADRTTLRHNTLYHTRAHGLYFISGQGTTLRDNIVCAGGGSGSALYLDRTAAEGFAADYNCYLDSGTHTLISWMPLGLRCPTFGDYRAAIPGQDAHSFCADPGFISTSPGAEDFSLRPDSPCRGRAEDGTDLGAR